MLTQALRRFTPNPVRQLGAFALNAPIGPRDSIQGFTRGELHGDAYKYGVIEAVHELCATKSWKFVYITPEPHGHTSSALRRL